MNLMVPAGKLLPRFGVYATTVELPDGREYRGITNVGDNPTVEGDRLGHIARIETFLIDFSGDLYDKTVTVRFHDFLRPEQKFGSLEDLKAQIAKDIAAMNHMQACQDDAGSDLESRCPLPSRVEGDSWQRLLFFHLKVYSS